MFFSVQRRTATHRRIGLAIAAVGIASAAIVVPATAAAALTSDLSVTQAVSTSGATGEVTFTITVDNLGPDPASGVVLIGQLKAPSAAGFNFTAPGNCFPMGAAPPYNAQFGCELPTAIPAGGSWVETMQQFGTTGKPVTQTVTVGTDSSQDQTANNVSVVKSFYGPAADKAVSNSVATGGAAGTRKITTTITNHGPSPATHLVTDIDILSPGIQAVTFGATGPATNCFFVAAPAGFTATVECDTSGPVASGAQLKLIGHYTGPSGGALQIVASISSTEVDPVAGNNSKTATTTYR